VYFCGKGGVKLDFGLGVWLWGDVEGFECCGGPADSFVVVRRVESMFVLDD